MVRTDEAKIKNSIFTLPNILSFFRLCLIPLIVWLYCVRKDYVLTTVVLVISGISDVADGFIARRYGMVSDIGKALDPIADKLTQLVTLVCLTFRFRMMLIPVALLVLKELLAGITGLLVIRKMHFVMSAVWHGKITTALLYLMMVVHLIWYDIPSLVSNILIFVCVAMMLLSAVLYGIKNIKALINKKQPDVKENDRKEARS